VAFLQHEAPDSTNPGLARSGGSNSTPALPGTQESCKPHSQPSRESPFFCWWQKVGFQWLLLLAALWVLSV